MNVSLKSRLAVGALVMASAAAAHAGTVDVFVGYADNLRPSGFFPSVWLGDPNVFSQTPSGQTLDSGAVRLDNNTGAPITISNFQVFFPNNGSTFSPWSSLALPTGATGIFTQTGSFNFDTSDFGVFASIGLPNSLAPNNFLSNGNTSLIGGCSSSASLIAAAGDTALCNGSAPVISFLVNGTPFSFTDTGQVLNTGGWDFVGNSAYGEDGNESINWNVVGSAAVRGGTPPIPEPSTYALFGLGAILLALLRRRRTGNDVVTFGVTPRFAA